MFLYLTFSLLNLFRVIFCFGHVWDIDGPRCDNCINNYTLIGSYALLIEWENENH